MLRTMRKLLVLIICIALTLILVSICTTYAVNGVVKIYPSLTNIFELSEIFKSEFEYIVKKLEVDCELQDLQSIQILGNLTKGKVYLLLRYSNGFIVTTFYPIVRKNVVFAIEFKALSAREACADLTIYQQTNLR